MSTNIFTHIQKKPSTYKHTHTHTHTHTYTGISFWPLCGDDVFYYKILSNITPKHRIRSVSR